MRTVAMLFLMVIGSSAIAAPAEHKASDTALRQQQSAQSELLRFDLSGKQRRPEQLEDSLYYTVRDDNYLPPPLAVHLGPFSVQSGIGRDGKNHVANYSLDGVNILGGDISGSIDGNGAKVFLRWHPGESE